MIKIAFIPSMRNNTHIIIYLTLIIPLAGELNFYPFNDFFRISFGMPTFFLFLLVSRDKISAILSGILAGTSVIIFRILLDISLYGVLDSFQQHYPTFFYYFTFGSLFYLIRGKRFIHRAILIGIIGVTLDILASLGELTFQYFSFNSMTTYEDIQKISVIAIFRSFFTVGILNLLILYKVQLKKDEIQQQNDQLTLVISSLYEESTNLHKTLISSENITKDAYELYSYLKETVGSDFRTKTNPNINITHMALKIAGETHEIKKDNQRILSGLSRLIIDKSFAEYMNIKKILDIALTSNKKYADSLGKNVELMLNIQGNHPNYHVYQILTIVNNIISNSIESIRGAGIIYIYVSRNDDMVEFRIEDNGPGISKNKIHMVFKPGFTNKYNNDGQSFTGIGLTYVKALVDSLDGEILLLSNTNEVKGCLHKIKLPIKRIISKG